MISKDKVDGLLLWIAIVVAVADGFCCGYSYCKYLYKDVVHEVEKEKRPTAGE